MNSDGELETLSSLEENATLPTPVDPVTGKEFSTILIGYEKLLSVQFDT